MGAHVGHNRKFRRNHKNYHYHHHHETSVDSDESVRCENYVLLQFEFNFISSDCISFRLLKNKRGLIDVVKRKKKLKSQLKLMQMFDNIHDVD